MSNKGSPGIARVMARHLTLEELHRGLEKVRRSPQDHGPLRAIVIRPTTDERESLAEVEVSPEHGVHGDAWETGHSVRLPDGRPHPDMQIAIVNARTMALIAGEKVRWPLAGDNLYVDLDLSGYNLPSGQRLSVGSSVLEVTDVPHNGCRKFGERFGSDAVNFVNSEVGRKLRLRGVYAKVVRAGIVRVGDLVEKL